MSGATASDRMGRHRFQLALCSLFALPFLANVVASRLGYVVFYLADLKIQLVWGTLCLLFGLWAFLRPERTGGRFGLLLLAVVLLGVISYVRSLLAAFALPETGLLRQLLSFGVESGLMLLVVAGRLWDARRSA